MVSVKRDMVCPRCGGLLVARRAKHSGWIIEHLDRKNRCGVRQIIVDDLEGWLRGN
jgi:hypothetical protein